MHNSDVRHEFDDLKKYNTLESEVGVFYFFKMDFVFNI